MNIEPGSLRRVISDDWSCWGATSNMGTGNPVCVGRKLIYRDYHKGFSPDVPDSVSFLDESGIVWHTGPHVFLSVTEPL